MNDTPTEPVAAEDFPNPETYRPLYPKALFDTLAKELGIASEESWDASCLPSLPDKSTMLSRRGHNSKTFSLNLY